MGAGSWGTTFAQVLCDAGTPAVLWARSPELAETIGARHENPGYLPGIALTPALTASADPARVLDGASLVVLAVPAQSLRQNLGAWTHLIPPGVPLVSLMKGIELGTCERMSEVSADDTVAKRLQQACHTPYFRPYTNPDVTGCELGGAVKNVIALAVGIAVGMGLGDNTRATLITRGLAEIARLGAALGADQHTFAGLAGLGDLVATCSSPLSRNRTFGEMLGRGMAVADVAAVTTQVAEGAKSAEPILELARSHA